MKLPDGTTLSSGAGLYIHIAYCRKKCLYCDFFSAGERIADWHRYTDALIAELNERIEEMTCPLQTIYVGGGTPSLIPEDDFNRLIDALRPFAGNVVEFTIEVNPDDVCQEKLELWKRGGVNRISIGIQSFDNQLLSIVGRQHDAKTANDAYNLARQYFDNISIDLMFGLPGQTVKMWENDVEEAIRLKPKHISAYSLMYEPGTALTALRDKGRLEEIPEEESESMFRILIEKLRNAGYDHYEISNFALPGFRSRHNSSYWLQIPYVGIGPSAHSYDGINSRRSNKSDL
ncbi:MAG: radical SAM family heme chaperone HemW [Muribaculaceae bacterium]|nr:radical SAM family heme chaperone HemW [Muribaculaceae bacterium]